MSKKIKITESQFKKLVLKINEAEYEQQQNGLFLTKQQQDDINKDKEKKSESERLESEKRMLKDMTRTFTNQLENIKPYDFIIVYFGNTDKNGVLYNITHLIIKVEAKGKDGSSGTVVATTNKNILSLVNKKVSLNNDVLFTIKESLIYFNIVELSKNKDGEYNMDMTLPIKDVVSISIKENKDPNGIPPNPTEGIKEMQDKYTKAIKNFLRDNYFKPGFLNMDNFFFFPTGKKVVEDIFHKYGIHIKRNHGFDIGKNIENLLFNIYPNQKQPIKFEKTKDVIGRTTTNNEIETPDYIFDLGNNRLLLNRRLLNIPVTDKKNNVFQGYVDIIIKRVDNMLDYNPNEENEITNNNN